MPEQITESYSILNRQFHFKSVCTGPVRRFLEALALFAFLEETLWFLGTEAGAFAKGGVFTADIS